MFDEEVAFEIDAAASEKFANCMLVLLNIDDDVSK